jgi:hypothetical protein
MEEKDANVLAEVYKKLMEIDTIIEQNNMSHRVLSVMMLGVIPEEDLEREAEFSEMKAIYNFNIMSNEELDTVWETVQDAYSREDGLSDLFNGTGVSLN